ncbi:MAG TPA: hypothetical protein PLZ58_02555 [Candidatus Saccharibacteria bacterium]|nr:hypothetical protein [Candidatus Saccharibacteria bacterium]HRQ06656.1 hypothetical protein [Candidatus Saccharibacteria bacterium]
MSKEPKPVDISDIPSDKPTEKFMKLASLIVNKYPFETTEVTSVGKYTNSETMKALVAEITSFDSTLGPEHRDMLGDIYTIGVLDGAGNETASLTIGNIGIAIELRDGKRIDYTDLTPDAIEALVAGFITKNNLSVFEN